MSGLYGETPEVVVERWRGWFGILRAEERHERSATAGLEQVEAYALLPSASRAHSNYRLRVANRSDEPQVARSWQVVGTEPHLTPPPPDAAPVTNAARSAEGAAN